MKLIDLIKKTGKYNEDFGSGDLIIRCPSCKAICDIFEEGACNYQAKRG